MVELKDAGNLVILLVIIAVMFAIGSVVMSDIKESAEEKETVRLIANETFVLLNCTTGRTTLSSASDFLSIVNTTITVHNTVTLLNRSNFDVNLTAPNICMLGGAQANYTAFNNTNKNISYSYLRVKPDYDYNNSVEGQKGLTNVSDWQKTVGTVVGAALVIGILVGMFAFMTKRNE
jgi:hypothetical protein